MALITRKALCETITPLIQIKRFRGKIDIRRPQPPHFERAKFLALAKPYFISKLKQKTMLDLCTGPGRLQRSEDEENPFQRIIAGELRKWFQNSRLVAFYHMNPMTAEQQFKAYVAFKKQKMHYKNYGKKTLKWAVEGTPYETVLEFYCSQNMTVFSPEPQIKKLLQITKKIPQLVLLAGIYDGRLLSKDELVHYSTIPNIQTAQAGLVQTLNSVGSGIVSKLNAHQTSLVSHLENRMKQLQE